VPKKSFEEPTGLEELRRKQKEKQRPLASLTDDVFEPVSKWTKLKLLFFWYFLVFFTFFNFLKAKQSRTHGGTIQARWSKNFKRLKK